MNDNLINYAQKAAKCNQGHIFQKLTETDGAGNETVSNSVCSTCKKDGL